MQDWKSEITEIMTDYRTLSFEKKRVNGGFMFLVMVGQRIEFPSKTVSSFHQEEHTAAHLPHRRWRSLTENQHHDEMMHQVLAGEESQDTYPGW